MILTLNGLLKYKHTLVFFFFPVEPCIWEWGQFGQCSATCGTGTRSRLPIVIREARFGGRPCPPYFLNDVPQRVPDVEQCVLDPCPGIQISTHTYILII